MGRDRVAVTAALVFVISLAGLASAGANETLEQLVARFERETGAKLVFDAKELPQAAYYDVMAPLPADERVRAAEIACFELRKLPAGFLGRTGLKAIGIFAGCASKVRDGFHEYDEQLGGYRYFGLYNGSNAVVAAFYTEGQLPLTLHHEVFHHVDVLANPRAAAAARTPRHDAMEEIRAGERPYQGLKLSRDDLAALKKAGSGAILREAVSEYASKNATEDAAETARYLMSHLPDSLVQMAERPELPGSQRLLHVLETYRKVPEGRGPDPTWFVNVALGRDTERAANDPLAAQLETMRRAMQAPDLAADDVAGKVAEARQLLDAVDRQAAQQAIPGEQAEGVVIASARLAHEIIRATIRPRNDDREFTIRGGEDAEGINWTLRADINGFGEDAHTVQRIARTLGAPAKELAPLQLQSLRLLARYYAFIASRWKVSEGTSDCFGGARAHLLSVVALYDAALAGRLMRVELVDLGTSIGADGVVAANPCLASVDREIEDPALRKTIRVVQPACVMLNRASGVNLSADGLVLTAAHVAGRLHAEMVAEFPDGTSCRAVCVAIDTRLDVALCRLKTRGKLPFASLAPAAPKDGDRVVCIGQPGTTTPKGKPTGYQPFNVSVGQIRGFAADRVAGQTLGGTKHDAWTYWGHSGSPLFNERGEIVAMHNSWDPETAMRHAVTHEAIVKFLGSQEVKKILAADETR